MNSKLTKLIQSDSITAFYQKRKNSNKGIRSLEIGQNKIMLLPIKDDVFPEYYLKDRNDNYELFSNTQELEELVSNYKFVNG